MLFELLYSVHEQKEKQKFSGETCAIPLRLLIELELLGFQNKRQFLRKSLLPRGSELHC